MRAIVLFFLISGMLTACDSSDTSATKLKTANDSVNKTLHIVTTIKPIQAIVSAIATDSARITQLIPDYSSPHDYNLKPSDIRNINNADVIFRIDERMEVLLTSIFQNTEVPLISLAKAKKIQLLDVSNHTYSHGSVDLHMWTSPSNASAMAETIAAQLKRLDPSQSALYDKNLSNFMHQVNTINKEIEALLIPFRERPYVVFHNSWQYFAKDFGLKKPLVVNAHEDINSSAKTLKTIRAKIIENDINCIFSDSSISDAQLQVLTENTRAQVVELDVLAKGVENTTSAYINWLKLSSKKIESCLSNKVN